MMLRLCSALLAVFALLGGCVTPLPPSPREVEARRFGPPPPGQAAVYLVRDLHDGSREASTVVLDDQVMGSTFPGTFFRWELAPGAHRIRGFAGDAGSLTIHVAPGGLYFVQQVVTRPFHGFEQSFFRPVPETYGRAAVLRGELVGGR